MTLALKSAPLIWATEAHLFRKLPLDELIRDIFQSFRTLFDYALSKRADTFEAEFLKYFHLEEQIKSSSFKNCL